MRKSWERDNKQLMDGYELVREGKVEEALTLFESMAQAAPNPTAKANLCCTIGVISISVGNYHYALQKFEESLTNIPTENHLLAIRSHSNLCLLYVLMGRYRHAH
jgi:tetratricopeptide (TPR) repeat protein